MTAPTQPTLFGAVADEHGLCRYGLGGSGVGTCTRPATHAACWAKPEGLQGRMECCLEHANYYAMGWLWPALAYMGVLDSIWMERLDATGEEASP